MPGENFSNGFTCDRSNPCYGCVPPERHLGCHDKCKKRAEWLNVLEAKKKHLKEYLDANGVSIKGYERVGKSIKTDGLIYGSKSRGRTLKK